MKKSVTSIGLSIMLAPLVAIGASTTFRLSINHGGVRASTGEETLRYSNLWDGDANATVKIAQDGVVLAEELTGEGEQNWSVSRNGTYALTHTTYTNGIVAKVENATFVVTGKDVPFLPEDIVTTGYNDQYDGQGHGISVTAPEGAVVRYARDADGPFGAKPSFTNACGATTVWYEVTKEGYIPYTNSATVAIVPRPVTLTSGTKTDFVYDGQPHGFQVLNVGGAGFVAGEGVATSNWATVTTVADGEVANAFDFAPLDGTKLSNYDIAVVTGRIAVVKATVGGGTGDEPGEGTIPAGGLSKFDATEVYDGKGHTIDTNAVVAAFAARLGAEAFAVTYAINGTAEEEPGQPVLPWAESPMANTNAGEYVVWYRVASANYEDFVHAAKVTVTKRPVTVEIAGHAATHVYDTTAKTVAGYEATTADALYDIAADTTFTGAATATRTDVGTTPMGLAADDFANTDANFDVSYAVTDGSLTIEPCVIGGDPVKWDIRLDKSPKYNGEVQSAPIIQVCYVKPDGNLDYIPYTLSGDTATDAGNYVVRITGTGNYTGAVEKDWAIVPRTVTLTSETASWTYDGATHAADAVSVTGDGFVAGEGATYGDFPQVHHVTDAATPRANTFTYALTAGTKAKNYEIATEPGTVQMTPRAVTLTSPTKSKAYDGTALTFAAADVAADMVAGEAFALSDFASITEAGQRPATFAVADGTARLSDYAVTPVYGTLTVTKSATEITVTAKNGSWTYDGAEHRLPEYDAANLGTLQAGDELEVTFDPASAVTTPADGPAGDGRVVNTITSVRVIRGGTTDVTANYTLAWYPGTLTVTRRPVTLTSKSDAKEYDGTALTAHEVTVGGDGFVGEDGATYSYTGAQTEKGTSENTFTYRLKSGTKAAYYDIATVYGTLEVTAADITGVADDDWQVVLGPALTYTGIAQVQTVSSITCKGLPLDYTVEGNRQTDAGPYEMTITGQGNFTGAKTVAWAIAPKALTLTAGSGAKVYDGAALTAASVTATGFVAGEGAAYACDGAQVNVGSSANGVSGIAWNAGTKASNYAVTKVPGTLTVTPRPITVTSKNITKPYDGTPLEVSAADIAVANIVAGESLAYSGFASRTEAGQSPATFTYSAGPGTDLANYTVTPEYGTITITKSATEIGVTAASESWIYDGEAHSNRTYTATNLSTLQAGDELEVTFDPASVVTTPADSPAGDGRVANTITSVRVVRTTSGQRQDVTANYTVTPYPGVLEVTKRPVTVVVAGHTATNTYDALEHAVTGYDIATEDELYDIAADTMFAAAATATRTDVGTTPMGLTAADFANGNGNFEVTYAVTDGGLTIAAADIAAGEADDFVLTLGANPTYNGTVQTIPVTAVTYRGLPVAYTLAGENATHAGTYTLTVRANGNFTGERSTTWQILKRKVTLTSGSSTRVYTGEALVNGAVTVGGDGFIGVEGATFTVTGSQTAAGTSKNAFAYALKAGTLAGDYEITKTEGDLVVTKRPVTLVSASASKAYDATPLRRDVVTVKPGTSGFADGEGFTATCSGTITAVGSAANAFSYTLAPNTQASNYTISTEYGTLTVTKGTLDPYEVLGEGGAGTDEQPRLCARVYNGEAQGLLVEPNLREPYTILYALAPPDFGATSPTRTNVADGDLKIHFRLVTDNYDPLDGVAILRIVPRTVTAEMLAYSEDAFFFDGADTKVPDVILVDTNALGVVISTANDYTRTYGERLATGEYPVTITGANNYTGAVTKAFAVLKRPVAPPVIPAKSYNGRKQKPTIPGDARWTVVANPGGVNAGLYTNVVLRLTNAEDYRWKPLGEDETDWTGVFEIKKAANGWSTYPGIKSWTNGVETASEPVGRARYGTVSVAYRRAGTDVAAETSVKPATPGKYIARFWVEPTDNYAGYALTVHYEVAFEIFAGPDDPAGGDATATTPVPVPYVWLDPYLKQFGGDYETAAHATGRNGVALWASYVAGLAPEDPASRFRARIAIGADGLPVVTWEPDLSRDTPPRTYTVYGKADLDATGEWVPVTEANKSRMRFFKVVVDL